jgi:apolipoprotein N-acyltransferase
MAGPRGHDAFAVVAGVALVFAFAPFGAWPLAVLAPAILFVLWRDCGRGRAAWRGWLFGLGYWGAGVYWIYYSLHLFGAAVAPLAAALTVVFVAVLALTLAVLGALVTARPREQRGTTWFLLVLPGAWVLLEWVRSWLLTGFPWLLLGTSQTDTWLAGYAPGIGVYGMGLIVAWTAGALALLVHARWRGALALVVAVGVWGGGAVMAQQRWTRPAGLPFDAALLQGNIEQKRKFDTVERALERYERLTRAVAGEAELVVWPETAAATFYRRVDERLNPFAEAMAERETKVVTGVFTADGSRFFNAVRELGPAKASYHKQHLVPFGEYMPMRWLLQPFERYIDIPMSDLSAGEGKQPVLEVGGYRLGASVCYEAAYPGIIRGMARRAGVLVNVSNDGWFGDSIAPHHHLQMARLRSMETARPMLRATNTGITAVIGYQGRVLDRAAQFEVAMARARVEPRRGWTPYMRMGDAPVLATALVLALLPMAAAAARRWHRQRR